MHCTPSVCPAVCPVPATMAGMSSITPKKYAKVAHVTCNAWTTFKFKRSKVKVRRTHNSCPENAVE